MSSVPTFQFHKGTIRTVREAINTLRLLHFNSIKVQLEPSFPRCDPDRHPFQFHKGTIRTCGHNEMDFRKRISIP